jgi:hypothetical protein
MTGVLPIPCFSTRKSRGEEIMETSIANLVSWCVAGPTTLHGYEDDLVYVVVRADTDDPDLQRDVALVSAWDVEGERYARMIAAVPKLLAACQAIVDRWESGDLAEAARMCAAAVRLATTASSADELPSTNAGCSNSGRLPCFGITIRLDRKNSGKTPGAGYITSDLKTLGKTARDRLHNAAIDGLESLILAHACTGVNVESPAYVEGIETAVDAITNQFT